MGTLPAFTPEGRLEWPKRSFSCSNFTDVYDPLCSAVGIKCKGKAPGQIVPGLWYWWKEKCQSGWGWDALAEGGQLGGSVCGQKLCPAFCWHQEESLVPGRPGAASPGQLRHSGSEMSHSLHKILYFFFLLSKNWENQNLPAASKPKCVSSVPSQRLFSAVSQRCRRNSCPGYKLMLSCSQDSLGCNSLKRLLQQQMQLWNSATCSGISDHRALLCPAVFTLGLHLERLRLCLLVARQTRYSLVQVTKYLVAAGEQ